MIHPDGRKYLRFAFENKAYPISRRLASPPPRPSSFTLPPLLVAKVFRHGRLQIKHKSELNLVQDIQFLRIRLRLDLGRALLPESKAQKIVARTCKISSQPVLLYQQVSQFIG